MADLTKGEWTFVEDVKGYWGSSSDDGIPIPQTSYRLYSPYPDFQCVATFTFKHDVEMVCNSLNDPKRAAAPDMYEALKTVNAARDYLEFRQAELKVDEALAKAEGK